MAEGQSSRFDLVTERRGTMSLKWEVEQRGMAPDTLPLWVADMDFPAPDCVREAMRGLAEHNIYGYSVPDKRYFDAVAGWFQRRHHWEVKPEWTFRTPGVVNALYLAVLAFTEPNDYVLVTHPVYPPFTHAITDTGRRVVSSELVYTPNGYQIDYIDFEYKIVQKRVKLFILCNPHNPVGRVWTREELSRIGEICKKRGVLVVSDEIHEDFVFEGHRHTVFQEIDPSFHDFTITCTAPSKTFNLAGLQLANIVIPNRELKKRFRAEYDAAGLSQAGIAGLVSCMAAYEGGEAWLEELLQYIWGNMEFVRGYLAERLPSVGMVRPEGTYLAWLDFRNLELGTQELDDLILRKAKVWLNSGYTFGAGGAGFMRLNTACPRSVIQQALGRIEAAIHN